MEMGFAETKDSWRGRPPFWSYAEALMIADVLESSTPELNLTPDLVPWDDGDDEAFRDGVAISIGDVVVIVSSAKDEAHGDFKIVGEDRFQKSTTSSSPEYRFKGRDRQ